MREESARGTRLHVTSVGGKRVRKQTWCFSSFLLHFLSESSGKHDPVFTMNFSPALDDDDRRDLAGSLALFSAGRAHTEVRSGDAAGHKSRAALPPTLSSRSFDVCERTNNRWHAHRKVVFLQKLACRSLLTSSLLASGLSVTMLRRGLDHGNQNTQDSNPSWLSSKPDPAKTLPSTFA